MYKRLILQICLTTLFMCAAHKSVAAFDWATLINRAVESGKRMETIPGEEVRYLERIIPNNPNQERTAEFFTLRGSVRNEGNFKVLEATGVQENWTQEDDHWKIYQWIFQAQKEDGRLLAARYRMIVKPLTGGSVRIIDLDSGDANYQQKLWRELLEKFAVDSF